MPISAKIQVNGKGKVITHLDLAQLLPVTEFPLRIHIREMILGQRPIQAAAKSTAKEKPLQQEGRESCCS